MIMRKLDNRNNWIKDSTVFEPTNAPSDTLSCLRTKGRRLSFFRCDSETSIAAVAAGLAASRDVLQEIECALIDELLLRPIGITLETVPGNTPSTIGNSLHIDAVSLTVQQMSQLAAIMFHHASIRRISKTDIAIMISNGITTGDIDRQILKPSLSKSL